MKRGDEVVEQTNDFKDTYYIHLMNIIKGTWATFIICRFMCT